MYYRTRSTFASIWLVSLLPLACSGSDPKIGTPPDEEPGMMEPEPTDEGKFLLSLEVPKLPILQGTSESVKVTVERQNGFEGDVVITASALPEGVTAKPLTIAADEAEGVLELAAPESAPHSLPTTVKVSGKSGKLTDARDLTITVYGSPGSVDTSFEGGKVMVPVGGADAYAYAIAAQADGKLVVAGTNHENHGDFALLRLTQDGELDGSFGEGGQVSTRIGAGADVARAVAIDAKGRIVVAGTASGEQGLDFAVARYAADGSLDATFGDGGKTVVSFGDDADTAYTLVLQPDGKILVGGDSSQGTAETGLDFALLRLLEDGAPDPDFGDRGQVVQSLVASSGRDSVYSLALQYVDGEQRIVAAGGEGDFALARFRADGSLDSTFGVSGKVLGLFGSVIGAARAVAVTSEGDLVVAGHAMHDFALAKLDIDGELVTTFGEEGRVVTQLSEGNWDEANGLALDADGRLLVAGWVYEGQGSSGNTALVRYTADGALDEAFGDAGIVVTEVAAPSKADQGTALVVVPDERVPSERILVAGYASKSYSEFAVTRFWR